MKGLMIILVSVLLCSACSLTPNTYTDEIGHMEDTLFKAFPSVSRVSIEVKHDFGSELIITLGDASLYHAADEKRTTVARQAADISFAIFGEEKLPGKGKVVFVEEENTIITDKDTWKIEEMDLAQFRKK